MKKKIAIVGYGGMGAWHGDYLLNSDVAELAGIYDIEPERMNVAKEKGIHTYASFEEILSDKDIDIVVCATPNDLHRDIVVKALDAGKNAISEKPVTVSCEDLQAMIDASVKNGKLFTAHQNRRWDEDYLSIKQIYSSGVLGDVFNIESRVLGSHGIPGDWRGKKEFGGGMMLDWGVHLIDQILQMVPEKIDTVYGRMDHITNYNVDDGFKLEIIFESGRRAFIEVGTSNFINLPRWYVLGENGSAYIPNWELSEGKIVCCENWKQENVVPVKTAAGLTKTMAPRDASTVKEHAVPDIHSDVHDFYRNVCKAIDGEEAQLITHGQMMRVMRVMEASFRSDELKQVIKFKE